MYHLASRGNVLSRLALYIISAVVMFSFIASSVHAEAITSSEQEQLAALSVRLAWMQSVLNWLQAQMVGTAGAQALPPPPPPPAPPISLSTPTPTPSPSSTPSPTPLPDTTPPVISAIATSQITSSGVSISWTTDEPATSRVEYGFTSNYGQQTADQPSLVTSHDVDLSLLSATSTYHFRVKSKDAVGNEAVSIDLTVTTLPVTPPDTIAPDAVNNLMVSNITQTSADISWTAPGDNQMQGTAAQYDIRYAAIPITSATFASTTQAAGLPTPRIAGTLESYSLIGLTPGATYYVALKTSDAVGNTSLISNVPTLTTNSVAPTPQPSPTPATSSSPSPSSGSGGGGGGGGSSGGSGGGGGGSSLPSDTAPPPAVTNTAAVGAESQISLTWKNPIVSDYVRTIIVRKEGSAPVSTSDGTVVYEGTKEEFSDIKLDNARTYYYAVYTVDRAQNYSSASIVQGKPQAGKISIGRSVTSSPAFVTASSLAAAIRFTKTLGFGMRDPEVTLLQQFLIQKGFLASDNDTGYFGRLTEAAVKKFQAQHDIISSGTPQTTGYGLVGRLTRQKLNDLAGADTGTSSSVSGLTETQRLALIEQLKVQIQVLTVQLLQLQIKLLQEQAGESK